MDEDGIFGQVPAAWLQAIGSVAAIVAAIWIDQGTIRRAEAKRLKQEAEAFRQRREVIEAAIGSLEAAAREGRDFDFTGNVYWSLSPPRRRSLRTALLALTFYRDDQNEIPPLLRVTLTHVAEIQKDVVSRLDSSGSFTEHGRDDIVVEVDKHVATIRELLSELKHGIW